MDMNEQAGDPFVNPNTTSEERDGVVKDKAIDNAPDEGETASDRLAVIQSLQDSHASDPEGLKEAMNVLDEFEAEKEAEATAEAEAENLSINDIRDIVKVTAQALEDAESNLEKANKAYRIASTLEVECSAKPTLVEMNRTQVKVTATEIRRKGRAMKALGELGFGDPKRKSHPPLFSPS